MRTPRPRTRHLLLASLASLAAAAAPARAQEAAPLELEVGESRPLGGAAARCDDLTVVSVTVGPQAVITGLKVGRTVCSVAVGSAAGARRVIQVKVVAPPASPGAAPKDGRGDRGTGGG